MNKNMTAEELAGLKVPTTFTERQISAAGRAMSDASADKCNIDREDNWRVYGEDFIAEARLALNAALRAAPPPLVVAALPAIPEGWKLVPSDPGEVPHEMCAAFRMADVNNDRFIDAYLAMLAATPELPAEPLITAAPSQAIARKVEATNNELIELLRELARWGGVGGMGKANDFIGRAKAILPRISVPPSSQAIASAEPVAWTVGNLLTLSERDYPGMGTAFAQVWQGDTLIARVYGDSHEEVRQRAERVAATQAASPSESVDLRNVLAIERTSDMGVNLRFASCRAASQFVTEIGVLASEFDRSERTTQAAKGGADDRDWLTITLEYKGATSQQIIAGIEHHRAPMQSVEIVSGAAWRAIESHLKGTGK